MRPLVLFAVVTLAMASGSLAARQTTVPEPSPSAATANAAQTVDWGPGPAWRRTREGWQPVAAVWPGRPFRPAFEPALWATLQVLLSLAALVSLPTRGRGGREQPTPPPKVGRSRPPRKVNRSAVFER